jgi:hypothetical protein
VVFKINQDFDQQEALQYQSGTRVELKQRPGVVDIIAEYDPMMVPPIWLVNDPQPRYPEELALVPTTGMNVGWLKAVGESESAIASFPVSKQQHKVTGISQLLSSKSCPLRKHRTHQHCGMLNR